MTKLFLTLLLAAAVRQGSASDVVPVAPTSVPIAAPAYTSAAAGTASVAPSPFGAYAAAAKPDPSPYHEHLSKADHLRIAAEHLEAAGRAEEARRVRQLEAEEQAQRKSESILIRLRMFELSLTKMGEVSSEKYGGSKDMTVLQLLTKLLASQGARADEKSAATASDDRVETLFEALCKDGLARVVARPCVVTAAGRPAFVFVGGEIGYPTKDAQGQDVTMFKEYGTRADVLANLVSGDRIHLDLRLRLSQLDPASSVQVGKNTFPAITTREVETGLNLRSGQTVLLGGLTEQRIEAETVNVQPDGAGHRLGASSASREVRHITNRVETFVLVRAEVATKETAETALIEK